ncbi:LOW QUALITY PROTEIN: hypothetical protein TorRG33x02_053710, partial [Trema orientale]
YYLSLFKASGRVIESLEKLIRDFLWDSSDHLRGEHLVAWDAVCRQRCKVGSVLVKFQIEIKLFKWLWRFPNETNSLWYKVIKSKYGLNPNNCDVAVVGRVTLRSPWKAISSLYERFFQLTTFKVGRGTRIKF